MIRIFLVFVLLLFPSISFAGQYELVKGKGVEVCEAYGKNLNSLNPPLAYTKLERKLNPEFKDFSKPEWERLYPEEGKSLFTKINRFLWERDANPIYYFPVTEWKNWRGTPKQYSRAWKHYKGSRQALLAVGLPISSIDIDNNGKIENIALDSVNGGILLVLNDDRTAIDLKKTALVLQHPIRKEKGKGELTADGRIISDALHTLSYNVFIYKQQTYFDLYIDLSYIFIEEESGIWGKLQPPAITMEKSMKRRKTEPDGILRVFITENQKTEEICVYQFK
mgnify:FL=1